MTQAITPYKGPQDLIDTVVGAHGKSGGEEVSLVFKGVIGRKDRKTITAHFTAHRATIIFDLLTMSAGNCTGVRVKG